MLGRPRKGSGHTRGSVCFIAQLHSNVNSSLLIVLTYFKETSNKKFLCAQTKCKSIAGSVSRHYSKYEALEDLKIQNIVV
jgi:hypothetical protein